MPKNMQIPVDNTIPKNYEGVEVGYIKFTPSKDHGMHRLTVKLDLSCDRNDFLTVALFQDHYENALGVSVYTAGDGVHSIVFQQLMLSKGAAERTYRIRIGTHFGKGFSLYKPVDIQITEVGDGVN